MNGDGKATATWVPTGPGDRPEHELQAVRLGVLSRPLPADGRRLEDQRNRIRPHYHDATLSLEGLNFKLEPGAALNI